MVKLPRPPQALRIALDEPLGADFGGRYLLLYSILILLNLKGREVVPEVPVVERFYWHSWKKLPLLLKSK